MRKKKNTDFMLRNKLNHDSLNLLLEKTSQQLLKLPQTQTFCSNVIYTSVLKKFSKRNIINISRLRSYCLLTGASKSVFSKTFGYSRLALKKLSCTNRLLMCQKLSW